MTAVATVLERLAAAVRERGGLLASIVVDPDPEAAAEARHGAVASGGPRTRAEADRYALLVEAIREGYLLHYGAGRVIASPDRDLVLLAGDQLYAMGLAELAALGDLHAVATLADVIALGAQAHAAGEAAVAEAVWDAGAAVVAEGPGSPAAEALAAAAARAMGSAP